MSIMKKTKSQEEIEFEREYAILTSADESDMKDLMEGKTTLDKISKKMK